MNHSNPREKGQVIIIIAIAIVILLGFAGLAIDAGMVYSDRRFAQNAADAAAMAGASVAALNFENQHIYLANWNCNSSRLISTLQTAVQEAISRADDNAFVIDTDMTDWNGVNALCNNGTETEDKYADITVRIKTATQTSFIGMLFPDDLESEVEAVARIRPRQPVLAGFAIAAMRDCAHYGAFNIGIIGGGNSGGVEAFDGGILINTSESPGTGCCGIDPPSSAGAIGIVAHDGFSISSVGSCTYNGESMISPTPIDTSYNGGQLLGDPFSGLPMPACTGNADTNGYTYNGQAYDFGPGNITGAALSNGGTLAPGIYCITGDVDLSGHETLIAHDVVLYFINGGTVFTGNSGLTLTAPGTGVCSPTDSSASPACTDTYQNFALIAARNNASSLEVRGNGGNAIEGLVYALASWVRARGGGTDPDETTVTGQVIAAKVIGNGNGSFKVTYQENRTYQKPTTIDLNK